MGITKAFFAGAGAVLCIAAQAPAGAQMQVYKCGMRSYSSVPCSNHVVNTTEHAVPPTNDARSAQNRLLAQNMRRLPGESGNEFATRRYRARMLETDRDECARLDSRIPFEQERLKSPHAEEVEDAKVALGASRKRYKALRC